MSTWSSKKIIHNRASEFMSNVPLGHCKHSQPPTLGGHPQMDGLVERLNRTLTLMLSKLVEKNGRNWDELLDPVLMAY